MIDFVYVDFNKLANGDFPELTPQVFDDPDGNVDMEIMIHSLEQNELELLVCLYLGMLPAEIIRVLGLRNAVQLYYATQKLRRACKKQKSDSKVYN